MIRVRISMFARRRNNDRVEIFMFVRRVLMIRVDFLMFARHRNNVEQDQLDVEPNEEVRNQPK